MADSDLFETSNTDDLGENVVKELRINNIRDDVKKMLLLFDLKPILTIDEILVGMKRKYDIEKTRNWVSSNLWNISKRNLVEKIEGKRGTYRKKN